MKRRAIASAMVSAVALACVAARAQSGPAQPAQPPASSALQPSAPASASAAARGDAVAPHPLVTFTPRFTPGETMRYQISYSSQSKSLVGGAIENPQGAAEVGVSAGFTLRLEVLTPVPRTPAANPAPAAATNDGAAGATERPPLRLRAVYESVTAQLTGDVYDPSASKLLAQYQSLQGRSIEFQLGPHGELEYIEGLDAVLEDPRALEAARAWLEQLGGGMGGPAGGAAPGQTWERTQVVADAPLKDTTLRSTSTYLRDEPCDVMNPAGEQCAVVLMRFSLGQKPGEKNPTPESFKRNGLRSSGQWSSQGESLVYVSLVTGRTVSVSQSSEELMDLSIRHEDGGLPFRYAGHSKTETHLVLLNGTPAMQ